MSEKSISPVELFQAAAGQHVLHQPDPKPQPQHHLQGSILLNSISADNFLDKLPPQKQAA
jgi:hypothetical protein